jgi:glutathione-independent formaldehyde dehydrogenase
LDANPRLLNDTRRPRCATATQLLPIALVTWFALSANDALAQQSTAPDADRGPKAVSVTGLFPNGGTPPPQDPICGSDQHMVRGRTSAPAGMVLGHEITGEVIEKGSDVEMIALGDLVSVPFNVACGRCRTCRETNTGVCLTVNPGRAGGAYGYVDMGGWIGGQARYVMVPYADFNLLKFPDKNEALSKIMDLTMLTDILPTGFHGALNAGVKPGSTVYVAGAGPVGLAAAASAQLLGAAVIMTGDMNEARLSHARKVGFVPTDLTKHDRLGEQVAAVVGEPTVDSVIDAVGFEAKP